MRSVIVEQLGSVIGPGLAAMLVPTWFVMSGAAALVAALVVLRRARSAGEDTDAALGACAVAYVAALVAGIAAPMIYDVAKTALAGGGARLRWAGMVSWCGYLAGAVAVIVYLRRRATLSPARFADLVAPGIGLSMVCARLGCFLAGCDYGQVTDSALAIRFPAGSPAHSAHVAAGWLPAYRAESLPVHPTQLYEASLGLALALICLLVARTAWARRRDGRVFAVLLAGYAIGRIAVEALRGDAGRGFVGPLSSAQLWSAIMLAVLAAVALRGVLRGRGAIIAAAAVAVLALAIPATASAEENPDADRFTVGGFVTGAAPLNRRAGQVPPLTGLSATATIPQGDRLRIGADLDGLANDVATHGTLMAVAALELHRSGELSLSARAGVGAVLFNFRDPSFTDQVGVGARAGVAAYYDIGERWSLAIRPIEFDLSSAAAIGPVFTVQGRVGLIYRHPASTAAPTAAPRTEPVRVVPPPAAPSGPVGPGGR
jgi:prolipoprotein diacylglyceryltransferase